MHYDIISAFIKSMRGSDPDAVLYWLARMIDAGEDPKFIARRIMIHASEDVGNADPQALLIAHAAFKSAEVIGYPARLPRGLGGSAVPARRPGARGVLPPERAGLGGLAPGLHAPRPPAVLAATPGDEANLSR